MQRMSLMAEVAEDKTSSEDTKKNYQTYNSWWNSQLLMYCRRVTLQSLQLRSSDLTSYVCSKRFLPSLKIPRRHSYLHAVDLALFLLVSTNAKSEEANFQERAKIIRFWILDAGLEGILWILILVYFMKTMHILPFRDQRIPIDHLAR